MGSQVTDQKNNTLNPWTLVTCHTHTPHCAQFIQSLLEHYRAPHHHVPWGTSHWMQQQTGTRYYIYKLLRKSPFIHLVEKRQWRESPRPSTLDRSAHTMTCHTYKFNHKYYLNRTKLKIMCELL